MTYILGALVILVILDGVLTNLLISKGIAWEANPFLFDFAGGRRFMIFKIGGVLLAALILWDLSRHHPRLAFWTTSVFVVIYSGIVTWNFSLLMFGI